MRTPLRLRTRPSLQGIAWASAACALFQACAPSRPSEATLPAPATTVGGGQAAELFAPGVISDARQQWRITFTPDGSTAYFTSSDGFFPVTRQATIYVTQRRGEQWSTPEVASFSGTWSDIDPFVSADGQRLYFSSIRPVNGETRGDLDIWVMERVGEGWGPPARLGDEVNTAEDELYPSSARNGTLYYASGPRAPAAGKHWDIFRAPRRGAGFAPGERLGPAVNRAPDETEPGLQAAWEFNPEISPDERTLIFTSLRPGAGLGDLYVSHRRGGQWSPALSLGPLVNTAADEYHPTLSPDGRWLYFVRRQEGNGDFYRIATASLPALIPPPPPAVTSLLGALQAAGAAQQAGDLDEMRRLLRGSQEVAPDNSSVLFFLAREEARAGNLNESLDLLERLAVQGTTRDIRADSGFARLMSGGAFERFQEIDARLRANAAPLIRSDTAFVLDDPDFIPEGIAYDPVGRAFYVGSLHRRSVVRIDHAGRQTTFIPAARDGLGQVLGMHVDPTRRRLWLATLVLDSLAPRHSSGVRGWAFLHSYELPGGRLASRHPAPDSSIAHLLNDLVVTRAGDVYVTDTEAHAVYHLAPGAAALAGVQGPSDLFHYPNGIALDSAGRRLYVAHFEGISVADLDGGAGPSFRMMQRPPGVTGGGIDGLYACPTRLVAVQALGGFQQVTAFELSTDGRAIQRAAAIERHHPIHDWATTGAIAGGDFHYLANAQLRRLAANGALSPPTKPGRSVILRIRDICERPPGPPGL